MPEEDVKKRLEEFQELFVEARYCIEDCTDAAESTYFDEEAETAKEAVAAAGESNALLSFDCKIVCPPPHSRQSFLSHGIRVIDWAHGRC